MAYEDIRNKFLPLLQRTQGIQPQFNHQAQGIPRFGGDPGRANIDVAGNIAMATPFAIGAKAATTNMLDKAIGSLQASPLAQNMRASLASRMSNRVAPVAGEVPMNKTFNNLNQGIGGKVTNDYTITKPGNTTVEPPRKMSPEQARTSATFDRLLNGEATKPQGYQSPAKSPNNNVDMYRTPNIQNQAQAQTQAPNFVQGQVTNNFSNTTPGNTVIQPAFEMSPEQARTSATFDRLLGGQAVTPQGFQSPVSIPSNNVSMYSGRGQMNALSPSQAADSFMTDLNSSVMNQFGTNASPMGSFGSMGEMFNNGAGNIGGFGTVGDFGGGMMNPQSLQNNSYGGMSWG